MQDIVLAMHIMKNIKCKKDPNVASRDEKYRIWNLRRKIYKMGLTADEIRQKRWLVTWRYGNGKYSK